MEIKLTRGYSTFIDDDDWPLIAPYRWTSQESKGRVAASAVIVPRSGKRVQLHRFLMRPGEDEVVDHIDGDALNNRRANLRVCYQSQNRLNCRAMTKNQIGIKGVALEVDRRRGNSVRYRASVMFEGMRIRRSFALLEEAVEWVKERRAALHGDFARHA